VFPQIPDGPETLVQRVFHSFPDPGLTPVIRVHRDGHQFRQRPAGSSQL
jgi:hypothetical protein